MNSVSVKNNEAISLSSIPVLGYDVFYEAISDAMSGSEQMHCVNYFAFPEQSKLRLICCVADDLAHTIQIFSAVHETGKALTSLTAKHAAFERFERELHERHGIQFSDHP